MQNKQAKIAKKMEEEKLAREKEQVYQQTLKETWQNEMQRYEQAKEAMRLARENK